MVSSLTRAGLCLSVSLVAMPIIATTTNPVAIVNGTPLTQQDYEEYSKARAEQTGGQAMPAASVIVEELINRELIKQDAIKKDFNRDPEFIRSLENARDNLLTTLGVRNYLQAHRMSDEQLKQEYEKRIVKAAPYEYKARHILVETEAVATTIIQQLQQGQAFEALAKTHSIDTESAIQGGDLGWVTQQKVDPKVAIALVTIPKGQYSQKPVKSTFGWHILWVEDRRQISPPAFEEIKEELRRQLHPQQVRKYVDELRKTAQIEVLKPDEGDDKKSTEATEATPTVSQ